MPTLSVTVRQNSIKSVISEVKPGVFEGHSGNSKEDSEVLKRNQRRDPEGRVQETNRKGRFQKDTYEGGFKQIADKGGFQENTLEGRHEGNYWAE
jgi:hypothetical protein